MKQVHEIGQQQLMILQAHHSLLQHKGFSASELEALTRQQQLLLQEVKQLLSLSRFYRTIEPDEVRCSTPQALWL